MQLKNQLLIASAWSWKTYTLVEQALLVSSVSNKKILITTYTEENIKNIKHEFLKQNNGFIPKNIIIVPWFSFLLSDFVRPFQWSMHVNLRDIRIWFKFIEGWKSGQKVNHKWELLFTKIKWKQRPIYRSEQENFIRHYFTKNYDIFSDKIAKFSFKCNEINHWKTISRIEHIYSHIFIDEIQDMAWYDFDILDEILISTVNVFMVGDPRQSVFFTNNGSKYKKFRWSNIKDYFEQNRYKKSVEIKELNENRRSNSIICSYSNTLYPNLSPSHSINHIQTWHDWIFMVKKNQLELYLRRYPECIQLRRNKKTQWLEWYYIMNFWKSKWCTFDRVLIYPTKNMLNRIIDNNKDIWWNEARAKLYVALTRARYSIAIVCDQEIDIEYIQKFE
jgi:DNA helicase II / ATP-dependent DNA helicase PcrA